MPEPTDFCPTLPEPYEALVRRALAATGIAALDHSIACNHAAAEAEHELRVAVRSLVREAQARWGLG